MYCQSNFNFYLFKQLRNYCKLTETVIEIVESGEGISKKS
jgi:hypothetical protein